MAKKAKGKRSVPEKCLPAEIATEPASGPGTPTQRPMTSPYTSFPTALIIGPERRTYYVPREFLQNPDWIASSRSWGQEICLPDMDENTSHVLVHYLYTGAYQTLDNTRSSTVEEVNTEFKRAVMAYMAAMTYKLHGLQELAKHQIEHFGAEMNVFDIVEAIKEDFSKLPIDTAWIHGYLEAKVKAAFEEDQTVFVRNGLFDRIEDVALFRILAKCVLKIYNDKVSRILAADEESVPVIPEEHSPDDREALPEESFAIEDPHAEECAVPQCPSNNYPVEECATPECPSDNYPVAVDEYAIPECPSDDIPVEECAVPEYPSDDYPVAVEECAVPDCPPDDYPIEESAIPEGCPDYPIAVEKCDVPECPTDEYSPQETFPEVPATVEETVDCNAPSPEPAPVAEEIPTDIYGWSLKPFVGTKKNKPHGISVIMEEPAPEPEQTATKEEYPKDIISPFAIHQPEEVDVCVSNGFSNRKANSEQPVAAEDGICPDRVKHLLDGDKWKSCRQCRAIVRQVAIQLARVDHGSEDGYEIVDQVLMK